MDDSSFMLELERLVERWGTEATLSLALDEFGSEYVDDIPEEHRTFYVMRCIALWEETQ